MHQYDCVRIMHTRDTERTEKVGIVRNEQDSISIASSNVIPISYTPFLRPARLFRRKRPTIDIAMRVSLSKITEYNERLRNWKILVNIVYKQIKKKETVQVKGEILEGSDRILIFLVYR